MNGCEPPRLPACLTRRRLLALTAGAFAATLLSRRCFAESPRAILRVAISVGTLAGANINDARAAYRVWLSEVARQYGTQTAVVIPEVFLPSEDLIRGIRQGTLDGYGLTAPEFAKVSDLTDPDSLVLQDYLADGIEYVLLVHNGSRFRAITDLRGVHMVAHLHRDMVLASAWLGTLLAANSLPPPEQFFASYVLNGSLNQVVLPVFFRRVDAACIARRSWETAIELNPQLGKDLRAVAVSTKLIPIVFGFRRNTNASARKALIDSIQSIDTVAAGQQIVALYQSHSFVVRPITIMRATLELLRQYQRIEPRPAHPTKGQA